MVHDQGSLVGLCLQDYKTLHAAVMICATLVNIQTDTQTAFDQVISTVQPADVCDIVILKYTTQKFLQLSDTVG